MCGYTRALKKKFSLELIQVFHLITNGKIHCPVCQKTHDLEEKEDE